MGNDFIDIACSYGTVSFALRANGMIEAWGDDVYGLLDAPTGNDFVSIFGSYQYNAFAIRSDGSIAAWGYDNYGQLSVPSGNGFAHIASGSAFAVALEPVPIPGAFLLGTLGFATAGWKMRRKES